MYCSKQDAKHSFLNVFSFLFSFAHIMAHTKSNKSPNSYIYYKIIYVYGLFLIPLDFH